MIPSAEAVGGLCDQMPEAFYVIDHVSLILFRVSVSLVIHGKLADGLSGLVPDVKRLQELSKRAFV